MEHSGWRERLTWALWVLWTGELPLGTLEMRLSQVESKMDQKKYPPPGLCVRCGMLMSHFDQDIGLRYSCKCHPEKVDEKGWYDRQHAMVKHAIKERELITKEQEEFPDDPTPVETPEKMKRQDLCMGCSQFDTSRSFCRLRATLMNDPVEVCAQYRPWRK